MTDLREQVAAEAAAAQQAVGALTDEGVAHALELAAALVGERRDAIAEANAADVAAADLDEGALDRLRLDDARIAALGEQLAQLAALPPLEREDESWQLDNGLQVSLRRIPIGAVGANFEARPNVAVDVAGQLLKSLNAAVLRTGGAALRTVTVLVDEVLRPALAGAGLPPAAVGLVRSPEREGARVLVSLPDVLPLVILRGSGETTAALAREAAQHGVRTLAHAEGGGVLYIGAAADPAMAERLVEASLDRLGVCNRLNLLLVDRAAEAQLPALLAVLERLGITVREPERIGHEWANDAERIASVTVRRRRVARRGGRARERARRRASPRRSSPRTPPRPSGSSRRTEARPRSGTRRRASPTASRSPARPRRASTSTACPGPRGPVTYRDLWLRQYRVVGDGTQKR